MSLDKAIGARVTHNSSADITVITDVAAEVAADATADATADVTAEITADSMTDDVNIAADIGERRKFAKVAKTVRPKKAVETVFPKKEAKTVRPKIRWTAMRQETVIRMSEQRDAMRAPFKSMEEEEEEEKELREKEIDEERVREKEGREDEEERGTEEGKDEEIEEALALGAARDTDRCAAWVAKNAGFRINLRATEYEGHDEEEEEEEDSGEQQTNRISPREAQAELQRQALMKQKRHAKDFTFKSLKNFWDKVEQEK